MVQAIKWTAVIAVGNTLGNMIQRDIPNVSIALLWGCVGIIVLASLLERFEKWKRTRQRQVDFLKGFSKDDIEHIRKQYKKRGESNNVD